MTARILAAAGALGIIATIWTGDLRFLWTGLLLLVIAIGIAANKDAKRKQREERHRNTPPMFRDRGGKLPTGLEYINNTTGKTERIYSGYHGIDDNKPGICKCGIPLTEH